MMASIVPVNLVYPKDIFTQSCIIPTRFQKCINLKIRDFISIQTALKKYICQVYVTALPLNCVFVDDVITSVKLLQSESFINRECINSFDDVRYIYPSTFDRVVVKVVFPDNVIITHCYKTIYETVISKILSSYVIEKDCVMKCSGSKLFSGFFNLCEVMISETFPHMHEYGKLIKSSKVEIIDVMFKKQLCVINKIKDIQLAGISNILNTIKLNFVEISSRLLVTGIAGCGKSSLVKKFCLDTKCFFNIFDGKRITDLTLKECNSIQNAFSSYSKMFPKRMCILFIDDIDIICPYVLKQRTLMSVSFLVNMINCLQTMHVSIIATAVQKNHINHKVSSLFEREINIGSPGVQQRAEILKCCTKSLICDIDYKKIAQMTPGFVGHDISLLVQEAINVNKRTGNIEKHELTMEDFEKALGKISPSTLKSSVWSLKVKPIYWKDIGGMYDIKRRLQMCIEWPLHNPEIFKKVDLPCPHGVLLFGPPGCCKTTLARGLATECNANFFAANPAQVYSPFVGESEKNITELFYQARQCAPSVIFLDELDSLVSQRKLDKKSQGIGEKVLSTLLNEMDGFGTKSLFQSALNMQKLLNNNDAVEKLKANDAIESHSNDEVIVVAATNRPDLIDDALLRPGRFDIILYVPPPKKEERESILHTLTKDMPVKDVDMRNIAEKTHLFSGADLKSLCNEAALNALRNDMSSLYVVEEDFNKALRKIQPSISKQQIEMYEKLASKYGTVIK